MNVLVVCSCKIGWFNNFGSYVALKQLKALKKLKIGAGKVELIFWRLTAVRLGSLKIFEAM